jgi:hypothetical protein
MSDDQLDPTPRREVANRNSFLEAAKVALPLSTAVLGFFIWSAQSKMQQTVDDTGRRLQAQMALSEELYKRRLALSEEYYKRRMNAYEETCKEIAAVKDALDNAQADPVQAASRLAELDRFQRSNALYLSKELDGDLSNLWKLGMNTMQYIDGDSEQWKSQIPDTIMLSHSHMKEDLNLKELMAAISGAGVKDGSGSSEPSK